MGGIKPLIADREAKPLYCCISDGIEYRTNQLHLGIVGGQAPAELDKRTAREVVHFFVDIQGIAPPDVEAEGVEGFLITQIVPLLEKAQAQKTSHAEVGPTGCAIEQRVLMFLPEEDGQHFAPEQVSP